MTKKIRHKTNINGENNETPSHSHDLVDISTFDNIIPWEIDIHLQLYGKHAWEVEYKYKCLVCEKRIDEYGFCACGSGSE
ncbi:MAG: hypothetical protein DA328_00180 [Nitrososphaeraceae archaeon]|nr:hypothetical protein [Nitrososphaeraceae archaeon]